MIVGSLILRLHLPTSESLKAKRQVVKSLTARFANQFGVAAAEVGELDLWQIAELGIATVANEQSQVERVLDSVVRYVEETRPDLEILDTYREIITVER
ncbi:MAG TPA: DUF503 domain-containing protein [Chloroflexota bacterium]|nr:DUF503 domain-containing protein [Chloroflexota bacterium]